jgi:hypothetical protein
VLPRLGYADFARASFAIFSELKTAGTIATDIRFQVSLPTPLAVLNVFIDPAAQASLEPVLERAMRAELDLILGALPHDELSLQWDVAVEIANLERYYPVFFEPVLDGIVERLARIAAWVPADVELGFHLCYGDAGGVHFEEPEDARHLRDVANAISAKIARRIDWIHLPVPIERDDDAYFAPLTGLRLAPETQLFLGLLHKEDGLDGARRRIDAARRVVPEFGVATECGMARDAAVRDVPGLLRLHREAAALL